MIDNVRSRKLRQIFCFLVPFVYGAVMLQSVTDKLFPADDSGELDFVRTFPFVRLLTGYDSFGLFRPLKNALWLVFSKLEPFGVEWCHVFAIAIGILSFFPVRALCRRVSGSDWKALVAASVWLLAPTLVSCVAWLSCLNIQVMVAFAALAIVFHDKAWDGGSYRPSRTVFACVFLFLSLASYECAVAVVPILLAFDWILHPERLRNRRAWLPHTFYWAIVFLYLLLRHFAGAKGMAAGRWIEATRGQLIVSSPWFVMQHLASWFWPFGRFSVGGSYVWGEISPVVLAACAMVGFAILALAFALRKRRPALSFSVLFAVLALAPVCNCLGFGNGPYGDYYLALASVGLATGSVELAWWLAEAKGQWRIPAFSAVAAFSLVRATAVPEAARWAHLWTRDDLAYAEAARNFPDSLQNLSGSIFDLMQENRWEEVLATGNRIESKVGSDSPRMRSVYYSRFSHALNVTRDRDVAIGMLDRYATATEEDETGRQVLFHRGRIAEILDGDTENAEKLYEMALDGEWDIGLTACADRLARLKALRGSRKEAISLWERALGIDPNNVTLLWNLSVACSEEGQDERCAELRDRVRQLTTPK